MLFAAENELPCDRQHANGGATMQCAPENMRGSAVDDDRTARMRYDPRLGKHPEERRAIPGEEVGGIRHRAGHILRVSPVDTEATGPGKESVPSQLRGIHHQVAPQTKMA